MDTLSTAQLFMLKACLASSRDAREEAVRSWEEEVVMNDLDFSSSRLIPYFFYRNQQDGISTKYDKRIKIIYKHWWLRTQHIAHELKKVHAALAGAGVKAVVIKGASLKTHYAQAEHRPMADLRSWSAWAICLPEFRKLFGMRTGKYFWILIMRLPIRTNKTIPS
jgi:hypothetical protein